MTSEAPAPASGSRRKRRRLPAPSPGPIAPGDSFATAGRKALWPNAERLLARASTVGAGAPPDDLRKLRVATRRLRAALRLFRNAYPDRPVRRLREGLSTLADEAGAVRDLDLRLAHLDGWASEAGLVAALQPLRGSWAAERERAEAALIARLEKPALRRFLERLVAFVAADAAADESRTANATPRAIEDRTASLTWDAYERLRAHRAVIRGAELETLHAIRIEAKRIRYTLEFFEPLLGPDRAWLLERLVALQDHLGALNDAAVRADAVRTFLEGQEQSLTPEERAATGRYLAESEQSLAALRRGVGRVWRPVAGAAFARRLGQAVVAPGVIAVGPRAGGAAAATRERHAQR